MRTDAEVAWVTHTRMVVPARVMVGILPMTSDSQPNTRDPISSPNMRSVPERVRR